jgi:hypothetical protein
VLNVSFTFLGEISTKLVAFCPCWLIRSRVMRYRVLTWTPGESEAGMVNEPFFTPVIELIKTVWTSLTRSNLQLNALAGSGPQSGSVPSPLNEITSPATTPVAAFGSRMVAVGVVPAVTPHRDVSFATFTVMGAESVGLPAASRTRAARVCVPFDTVRESHASTYGAVATTGPRSTPSTRN